MYLLKTDIGRPQGEGMHQSTYLEMGTNLTMVTLLWSLLVIVISLGHLQQVCLSPRKLRMYIKVSIWSVGRNDDFKSAVDPVHIFSLHNFVINYAFFVLSVISTLFTCCKLLTEIYFL